jgi:hypothetical protein
MELVLDEVAIVLERFLFLLARWFCFRRLLLIDEANEQDV